MQISVQRLGTAIVLVPFLVLASCCAPSTRADGGERGGPVPIEDVEVPYRSGVRPEPLAIPGLPEPFHAVRFDRTDGSHGVAYLSNTPCARGERKPVLLWCEGSGAQSVFARYPEGLSAGLFGYLAEVYGERFHVAVVEKRGVGFAESVEQPGSAEGASREYQLHATWEDRVTDQCTLLDALLERDDVDPTLVLVIGHSEGGDVASGLAAVRDEVTHVAVLAGAGPSQFAELLGLARGEMRAEGASEEEIEDMLRWHEREYAKVLANPDSVDDMFYGHAYRRWGSFVQRPPVDSLCDAKARIYLAQGTRDRAVPIESFDLVLVELLRRGKDVTWKRLLGADHNFQTENDQSGDGILRALDEVVAWAEEGRESHED
ncbi:MAG: alpha/beta fold hydrolase [Planctomycetota bacterium]